MLFDEYKYAYYYFLRAEARSRVVNALNRRIKSEKHREIWRGITLASIKPEAIEYAQFKWSMYYNGDNITSIPVSWEKLYYSFSQKYAHFNVAVWQTIGEDKILRGMAFGKPSRGKTHLTINWIERSYEPPYFKGGVLLPILACAEEYAKLLGCERVLIKEPVEQSQFDRYGYGPSDSVPKGAAYVVKELNHG